MMFETVLMVAVCIICFVFGRITAPKDEVDYNEGYDEGWMNAWSQFKKGSKIED